MGNGEGKWVGSIWELGLLFVGRLKNYDFVTPQGWYILVVVSGRGVGSVIASKTEDISNLSLSVHTILHCHRLLSKLILTRSAEIARDWVVGRVQDRTIKKLTERLLIVSAYHIYSNSSQQEEGQILSVKYEDGRWSKPYYDCGGGNIWMLTYTVPFFGFDHDNESYFYM